MNESSLDESSTEVPAKAAGVGEPSEATHWSVVLRAQQVGTPGAAEAMEELCRTYWYPLYAYIRHRGYNAEEAEDLTQDFFAHWLQKEALNQVDQSKGRFRSFLLVSARNFLANAWARASREKRGGGRRLLPLEGAAAEERYRAELICNLTPDKLFDRRWALRLLEHTLDLLQAEQTRAGKAIQFSRLASFLTAEDSAQTYPKVGSELGMSRDAVAMAVHRLRQRFRILLRREIARTVSRSGEVEEELACLMAALRD